MIDKLSNDLIDTCITYLNTKDNSDDNEYSPKMFRFRGRGLNENGFNINPEHRISNPNPYEWNTDNNVKSQTTIYLLSFLHSSINLDKFGGVNILMLLLLLELDKGAFKIVILAYVFIVLP